MATSSVTLVPPCVPIGDYDHAATPGSHRATSVNSLGNPGFAPKGTSESKLRSLNQKGRVNRRHLVFTDLHGSQVAVLDPLAY